MRMDAASYKLAFTDEQLAMLCARYDKRIDELAAENDKLRELVKLDWEWSHTCCGSGCRLNTEYCGYAADRDCNFEREIYDRLRELGIEVDG